MYTPDLQEYLSMFLPLQDINNINFDLQHLRLMANLLHLIRRYM